MLTSKDSDSRIIDAEEERTYSRAVFVENLKDFMAQNDTPQYIIAKAAGVSKGQVSHWLKGMYTPRMSAIDRLCYEFNVPRSFFLEKDHGRGLHRNEAKASGMIPVLMFPPEVEPIIYSFTEQLNEVGRQKLLDYLDDLLANPKYRK